jgi:CRP-like cAMP-binding protein
MKKPILLPMIDIMTIPLFNGLTESEVVPLIQDAHEVQIQAGEYFFLQGDPAERLYVLISGWVKLNQVGHDGKQVLIQVIKPVHPMGLVAMTAETLYSVSALAARDSAGLYWTRHELMRHVMRLPKMALNAMRIMAEQLQEIQDRFRQVTTQRVEQRLAHTLIRLAAQSGKKVNEGILIDHTLTRQDLAEMSGTTIYTASRILSQWHGQDLVFAGRKKVIIRNPHALVRIVESTGV